MRKMDMQDCFRKLSNQNHGKEFRTPQTKLCLMKKPIFDDQTPDPRENEDCLYLNVFTPQLLHDREIELMPVVVYIHGGMFQSGDPTQYDFSSFLEADIVVVTMNYRVGALGFLTTGDGVIPGNLGLKDQNFSLKWVKRNIHLFGGDPSKVTLVGHSSGGISVGFHVFSEKSKGLFRGAIVQSLCPLNHIAIQKDPRYRAFALGSAMSQDFTSKNTSDDLLRLLMSIPGEKLSRANFEVIGDGVYTIGTIEHAHQHSKYADTYFYMFSYKGPINGAHTVVNKVGGLNKSAHVDELPLLYSYRLDPNVTPSSMVLIQQRIRKLWANFVKYQNSTPTADPLFENLIWPKVRPEEIEYFEIDEHISLGKNPRLFNQWKARFERYLELPLITYY